jgi:hypothetical protein
MLHDVVIIDEVERTHVAGMGSTVLVEHDGVEEEYTIVGPAEAKPAERRISDTSPLGQALRGAAAGDDPAGAVGRRLPGVEVPDTPGSCFDRRPGSGRQGQRPSDLGREHEAQDGPDEDDDGEGQRLPEVDRYVMTMSGDEDLEGGDGRQVDGTSSRRTRTRGPAGTTMSAVTRTRLAITRTPTRREHADRIRERRVVPAPGPHTFGPVAADDAPPRRAPRSARPRRGRCRSPRGRPGPTRRGRSDASPVRPDRGRAAVGV